jgi:integrase
MNSSESHMSIARITKRTIDALKPTTREFTRWDDAVAGFGIRVRPSGAKSFVVVYRAGPGRGARVRRFTIGNVGKITPDSARARAKAILGAVAMGDDPADRKATERDVPTVAELADRFLADHVRVKRKASTEERYRDILHRIVKPELGATKADKLTRMQLTRLHSSLARTPVQANRMLAVVGSMYAFGSRIGLLAEGVNPARRIDKFKESRRERFLTADELKRLGKAIRRAETTGVPWIVDHLNQNTKHVPKTRRFTPIAPSTAAALRLLLFTGCRVGEILQLRWDYVDVGRGCLFLPDSKTGRKTIVLNAPALSVLNALERIGPYVIPGEDPQQPRTDLKRPWAAVTRAAGLTGVRLHDLRHTYASFGAGSGLGLPIIGRLLGHSQAATTARYAHLDNDPLRRASEAIAGSIAAALDGGSKAPLLPLSINGETGADSSPSLVVSKP